MDINERKIREILNEKMIGYEETSHSFNKLLLLSLNTTKRKGIFLHYRLDKNDLNLYLRYLQEKQIEILDAVDFLQGTIDKTENLLKMQDVYFFKASSQSYHRRNVLPNINRQYLQYKLWNKALPINLPFVRSRGEEIRSFVEKRVEKFADLLVRLNDDESRNVLLEVIRAAVTNDVYRLPEGSQYDKYWECFGHRDDEVLVNCGSAGGDTILKFLTTNYKFEKIYAFEGEEKVYQKLVEVLLELPHSYREKIDSINEYIGLDTSSENFDKRFNGKKVTFINMDIEGAELGVLNGAKKIVASQRPVISVCAYHNASDLIDIPDFIDSTAPNYHIYLRKYKSYEPNALNEYLYYLVPKERIINNINL